MKSTISYFLIVLIFPLQCSSYLSSLKMGSSLSVEKHEEDVIVSPDGTFSAGFIQIGENAFSFGIWFTELPDSHNSATVVWMANREQPVNGIHIIIIYANFFSILFLCADFCSILLKLENEENDKKLKRS